MKSFNGIVLVLIMSLCVSSCQNNPPVCTIIHPTNNANLELGDTIEIIVEASDVDSGIKSVNFFIDGGKVYSTEESPYNYYWISKYSVTGEHIIRTNAESVDGEITGDEISIVLKDDYTPPTALFNYTIGRNYTVNLDASYSHDNEDDIDDLQVRWDWNNDGNWDTDFSNEKQITHQYPNLGTHRVTLMVKDTNGETDIIYKVIKVLDGSVTDIDNNVYSTIIINGKEWMAENLKTDHYRNGDPVRDGNLTIGASFTYNNEVSYADTFGYLYNWYAINDARGLAPEGWHVATEKDYEDLCEFISEDNGGYEKEYYEGIYIGDENTGDYIGWENVGRHLKSTSGWKAYYGNGNGSDDYNFCLLPGGYRNINGKFYIVDKCAYLWTSEGNHFRSVGANYTNFTFYLTTQRGNAMSVRCVKD